MQTIHRSIRRLSVALVVAVVVAVAAIPTHAAYRYLFSNTTLSAAITSTQTSFAIASASASTGSSAGSAAVGQCLVVDYEVMRITAVSGTTMTVQRGSGAGSVANTSASAHASGRIVYRGDCSQLQTNDPPMGTCLQANMPGPWINVRNGYWWFCPVDTTYTVTNVVPVTFNSQGLP